MCVCGLMSDTEACHLLSLPLQIISCDDSLISLMYELKFIQVLFKKYLFCFKMRKFVSLISLNICK